MLFQIPQWAIRLTERIRGGSRWFARLMEGIPGDRKLVTPFEAIVETGTVWFRYNVYRSEEMGEAMLELSVDVPYPDGEEAVGAVDKAIEALVDGWWADGLLDSCDWKIPDDSNISRLGIINEILSQQEADGRFSSLGLYFSLLG